MITGGLQAESAEDFALPLGTTQWWDPEASHLVCLQEGLGRQPGERFRLRVAPDTDLLFQDHHLVGWLLTDPARYLCAWGRPDPSPPHQSTGPLLAECMALDLPPLLDDVMDGEKTAWQRLRRVEKALHQHTSDPARTKILAEAMGTLIEDNR